MSSHYKYKLLLIIFISSFTTLSAQQVSDYSGLKALDFENITLPPLSTLFENAKNSPIYEFNDVQVMVQKSLLDKQKKDFLSFFSLRGSYQYGKFSNDGFYSDVYTPAIDSYSSHSQHLYTVGAGISIPLDKIFDLSASTKRQKLAVRSAELEREMKFEELKKEIIELYSNVLLQINTLKLNDESLTLASTTYSLAEKDFVNGKITPDELSTYKTKEGFEKRAYETSKFELIKNLMTLELISHTQFLKK
jgi:outer membrane protein TolC